MAVNFFVNRLYVLTADGRVAYDESFHHGVNIIRGANSSGKSTITRLLFYALGGDYTQFVPEARHCSRVLVEISTGGATITLSRPIMKDATGRVQGQQGMTIYWGTLDEALADQCEKSTFGYKATANNSSFSKVLFETMGMPIVQGDSNITMHQLLRLLYIDQESPTSSLFLYEQFDSQTTRETVSDLLLGIFDEQLYAAKIRQKELETTIADTQMFIAELERKQLSLRHSVSTRQLLGNLRLEYCPECLSPLPQDVPEGTCHLCRQKVENKSGVAQAKRLISELNFQQQESEAILRHDEEKLVEAKAKLRGLKAKRKTARKNLDELLGNVRSSRAEAIEDLIYKKGEMNGELTQYYTMLELAEKYEMLVAERERLESDLAATKRLIEAKTAQQKHHRSIVMSKIQEYGVYFLHHDKESQQSFTDSQPSDFMVDFSGNLVYLHDPNNKYSASSSFFLKLVARFALFFASLDISWMRYPRFIFADNMEDKGIEMERAQKFQYTLIDKLKEYDTDSYQVIYTTSYITEELDHSEYVVGDHYTMHNKSLKNVR